MRHRLPPERDAWWPARTQASTIPHAVQTLAPVPAAGMRVGARTRTKRAHARALPTPAPTQPPCTRAHDPGRCVEPPPGPCARACGVCAPSHLRSPPCEEPPGADSRSGMAWHGSAQRPLARSLGSRVLRASPKQAHTRPTADRPGHHRDEQPEPPVPVPPAPRDAQQGQHRSQCDQVGRGCVRAKGWVGAEWPLMRVPGGARPGGAGSRRCETQDADDVHVASLHVESPPARVCRRISKATPCSPVMSAGPSSLRPPSQRTTPT